MHKHLFTYLLLTVLAQLSTTEAKQKRCILTGEIEAGFQGGRSMLKVIMCSIVGAMHGGRRREVLFQER